MVHIGEFISLYHVFSVGLAYKAQLEYGVLLALQQGIYGICIVLLCVFADFVVYK